MGGEVVLSYECDKGGGLIGVEAHMGEETGQDKTAELLCSFGYVLEVPRLPSS